MWPATYYYVLQDKLLETNVTEADFCFVETVRVAVHASVDVARHHGIDEANQRVLADAWRSRRGAG